MRPHYRTSDPSNDLDVFTEIVHGIEDDLRASGRDATSSGLSASERKQIESTPANTRMNR